MSISEILDSVQFVVDKKGQQTAVQLDLDTWILVRHLLEEIAEDEALVHLLAEADDEYFTEENAWETYQSFLAEASQ